MHITIPYTPRPQQADLHKNDKRFKICVSHRRWGKSVYAITEILRKALEIKTERKDGRYAYIAPYYRQAKAVAWDYLLYYTKNIPLKASGSSPAPYNRIRLPLIKSTLNSDWFTLVPGISFV